MAYHTRSTVFSIAIRITSKKTRNSVYYKYNVLFADTSATVVMTIMAYATATDNQSRAELQELQLFIWSWEFCVPIYTHCGPQLPRSATIRQ